MHFLKTLLFGTSLCFFVASSFAGGNSSGGSDVYLSQTDSAWFIGPQTIHYCYQIDAAFPLSESVLKDSIEKGFQKWKSYLDYKGVNDSNPGMELILNHQLLAKCDGTEDLTFYFGNDNDRVEKEKAMYQDPIAFVKRESYDDKKGWGKGFVWISPKGIANVWSSSTVSTPGGPPSSGPPPGQVVEYQPWTTTTLSAIVLHEMGHVLGNAHVQGTIMDAKIADVLLFNPALTSTIDETMELAENRRFHSLAGTYAPTNEKATLVFKGKRYRDGLEIVIQNKKGNTVIPLFFDERTNDAWMRADAPVFKVACPAATCEGAAYQSVHSGYLMGYLTQANGKKETAMLEYNLPTNRDGVTPTQIKYWHNGVKHDLFLQTVLY
jgi:hypothetical protein